MKKTTLLLASTALVMGASGAFAGSHTGSITAVSWGGAYTVSQIEAYHKPWTAATATKLCLKTIQAVSLRSKRKWKLAT